MFQKYRHTSVCQVRPSLLYLQEHRMYRALPEINPMDRVSNEESILQTDLKLIQRQRVYHTHSITAGYVVLGTTPFMAELYDNI